MTICEFCSFYREDAKCTLGLTIPRHMGCHEFSPGLEKFCSDRKDFKGSGQIIQMATFFGIKGAELKKVKSMASREERLRLELPAETTQFTVNES